MLTTAHREWAERARRLREHAMSVSAKDRQALILAPAEEYAEVGFNYRMTDLQAAVGIVQLGRLGEIVARRRELAAVYANDLAAIDGLRHVVDPAWGTSNFQSYWIEVEPSFGIDREGALEALARADVSARRGIMASHLQPAYRDLDTHDRHLPVTERLTKNTLILPLFHQMANEEQQRVVDALRGAAGMTGAA
jgi:dTDP-4-amino-4,6-dideoxygalactose transaminase